MHEKCLCGAAGPLLPAESAARQAREPPLAWPPTTTTLPCASLLTAARVPPRRPAPLQGALCDDDAGVRAAAGGVFNVLFKSGGGSAMDSVIPALLGGLDSEAHSEQVLCPAARASRARRRPPAQDRRLRGSQAWQLGDAGERAAQQRDSTAHTAHTPARSPSSPPSAGAGGPARGAGRAPPAAQRDGAAPHQAAGHIHQPARARRAGRGGRCVPAWRRPAARPPAAGGLQRGDGTCCRSSWIRPGLVCCALRATGRKRGGGQHAASRAWCLIEMSQAPARLSRPLSRRRRYPLAPAGPRAPAAHAGKQPPGCVAGRGRGAPGGGSGGAVGAGAPQCRLSRSLPVWLGTWTSALIDMRIFSSLACARCTRPAPVARPASKPCRAPRHPCCPCPRVCRAALQSRLLSFPLLPLPFLSCLFRTLSQPSLPLPFLFSPCRRTGSTC